MYLGAETISSGEDRSGACGEDCARAKIDRKISSHTQTISRRKGSRKSRARAEAVSSQRVHRTKGICM